MYRNDTSMADESWKELWIMADWRVGGTADKSQTSRVGDGYGLVWYIGERTRMYIIDWSIESRVMHHHRVPSRRWIIHEPRLHQEQISDQSAWTIHRGRKIQISVGLGISYSINSSDNTIGEMRLLIHLTHHYWIRLLANSLDGGWVGTIGKLGKGLSVWVR